MVYFLEQVGLSDTASFDFDMGEYSLDIVGVFIALFLEVDDELSSYGIPSSWW